MASLGGKYGTALQEASSKLLLEYGANANIQSGTHAPALQVAVKKRGSTNGEAAFGPHRRYNIMVEPNLVELQSKTVEVATALQAAAYTGRTEIAHFLKQRKSKYCR
ncbi:hypothetical protein C8J57DRAFT_1250462 [Mycena rebaudengoi]|nr:hypothetical protein C8J57DRAFT_1250462 [Mycena rebaudengoi]